MLKATLDQLSEDYSWWLPVHDMRPIFLFLEQHCFWSYVIPGALVRPASDDVNWATNFRLHGRNLHLCHQWYDVSRYLPFYEGFISALFYPKLLTVSSLLQYRREGAGGGGDGEMKTSLVQLHVGNQIFPAFPLLRHPQFNVHSWWFYPLHFKHFPTEISTLNFNVKRATLLLLNFRQSRSAFSRSSWASVQILQKGHLMSNTM